MNTLADSIKTYGPAIQLTRIVSRRTLRLLRITCFTLMVLSVIATLAASVLSLPYVHTLFGVTLVCFSLWLEQILIYSYHNSFYFRGLNSVIGLEQTTVTGATYDVAEAVMQHQDDVAYAFVTSTFGENVLLRAGVSDTAIHTFLNAPRQKITADMVILPEKEIFSIIGLGKYLMSHDVEFKNMLKSVNVSEETLLGTLRWIVGTYHQQKRRERWWSRDNLSRTQGIGREWSYGTAYLLQQFARDIRTSAVFSTIGHNSPFALEKIQEIEMNLARARAANILIVGEAGVGKMDIIIEIDRRMRIGKSLAAVEGQHIIVLDSGRLFAAHRDKQALEVTLLSMFDEAIRAGNIILIIENLSSFIREAETMGVFLPELLDPYLSSPELHVIATDTPSNYHTYLEPLGSFTRRFAEVLIDTPDMHATTRVLQSIALGMEVKQQVLFTYPALQAITISADRYVVEGVMPDKAIELLTQVATRAQQNNVAVITEDFVYQIVSDVTGVPAGPIKDEERELLLTLKDRLHKQVVGQERALDAIARTMRRARAGIQSSEKPIGSFLFLGPTGVGKTETAKALANIFFGGEGNLQRIDMSEFSGADGLQRLIGTSEQSGVLADMLREHPYCVLLLDEFEKATRPVHDLFLQILDEGVFTDARGNKVNARNCIIIATSNAGSQLIMRTVQQREVLSHLTQSIIDGIISEGIFRPELVNRFDSTIIFEPLTLDQQGEVASLMLGGLYNRIKERGYELQVGKDLMEILVAKGYHPEFGARPMQRVLQDMVEEKVAQKIISGTVQRGSTIVLTRADFTEAELATEAT